MLNGENGHSKPKKIGRPRYPWTERLETLVLARIASGESLVSITNRKRFPSYFSVMKRIHESQTFAQRYAYARELQAERMAEEILGIADDGRNDKMKDEDGKVIVDFDHINRSRLRVDSRKWIAAKLLPKKYGDKGTEINVAVQTVVMDASRMKALQERSLQAEAEVKTLSTETLPPQSL